MTANTILDRAFPVEPVIATAIRDAALGQHEQDAMLERCDIGISRIEFLTTATGELKTWYEVRQGDEVVGGRFEDDDAAWTFAYDLAGQLVADGLVTL